MIHRSKNGGMHMKNNDRNRAPWESRFQPGDLVKVEAQFSDGKDGQGLVLEEIKTGSAPGYQILVQGKRKYFPLHLLRMVSSHDKDKKEDYE